MGDMYFSGTASCPEFVPNRFRKNVCSGCQSLIQNHSGAKDEFVKAAIEYSVDSLPSKIWSMSDCHLFMGGFKSAMNIAFLTENRIGLIVCAAKNLSATFGSKYKKLIEKRRSTLPEINEVTLDWVDSNQQKLDKKELSSVLSLIHRTMNFDQKSVLVHCAQGKSRSAVVCIAYLASLNSTTMSLQNVIEYVKSQRKMAEPNPNFHERLKVLELEKAFDHMLGNDAMRQ